MKRTWLTTLLCWLGLHQPIATWGSDLFIGGYCVRCEGTWQLPAEPRT